MDDLALEERGQVARRERRHRARLTVGLELEQRAEVRVDRLPERDLGHHEDAARNSGTGSATPFSSMAPSSSIRSRTRSRSASNVSIFHTVSRTLEGAHRCQTRERLLPMRAKTSQACSPLEVTGVRIFAHLAPVSCQGLLADASARPGRPKTAAKLVVASANALDPVSIPHDIENRRVATRIDQERNPQVSGAFQRSPQVTGSARLNLSRWRHGFEPHWGLPPDPRKHRSVRFQEPRVSNAERLTLTDSAQRVRRKAGRRPCGRSPPRRPTGRCPGVRSRAS
jgi:hypothetical protein